MFQAQAKHIAKISSVCYYYLQRLKQVRRILVPEIAARLVSAYVISRLDYCNSVLAGLSKASIILSDEVDSVRSRNALQVAASSYSERYIHFNFTYIIYHL